MTCSILITFQEKLIFMGYIFFLQAVGTHCLVSYMKLSQNDVMHTQLSKFVLDMIHTPFSWVTLHHRPRVDSEPHSTSTAAQGHAKQVWITKRGADNIKHLCKCLIKDVQLSVSIKHLCARRAARKRSTQLLYSGGGF